MLHWSGDQPLLTTDAAGKADSIQIGTLGQILPQDGGNAGLTLYDRGPEGAVGGCDSASYQTAYLGPSTSGTFWYIPANIFTHTSASSLKGAFGPCGPGQFKLTSAGSTITAAVPSSPSWWPGATGQIGSGSSTIGISRPDGFTDSIQMIAGVRAYDPVAGIWTTPDFYQGDPMEPATLKSYVWNDNNPIANVDPTGYLSHICTFWNNGNGTGDFNCFYSDDDPTGPSGGGFTNPFGRGGAGPLCLKGGPTLPPGYTYSAEYAAGVAQRGNLTGAEIALGIDALPPNAPFNYQHQAPGYAEYRDAGNFGLGVFAQGAGIPQSLIDQAIQNVGGLSYPGHRALSPADIQRDIHYAALGRAWAAKNCSP